MFSETLSVKLVLNGTINIPAGDIKGFDIQLYNYGFRAKVDFWGSLDKQTDSVFDAFILLDLMEAKLTIEGYHNLSDTPPDPFVIQGIVTEKSMAEVTYQEVDKSPLLYRHYTLLFEDPARVLWSQHFPCELYTEKSVKDVLDGHKGSKITMEYSFDPLTETHPSLCLGLGGDKNRANFYDFVLWYVDFQKGVFDYLARDNKYKISGEKNTSGTASKIPKEEVEVLEIHFPETLRYNTNVLNSYTEKTANEEVTQDQVLSGVRQDILTRTAIEADFNKRVTLETNRLKLREHEAVVSFSHFPTVTLMPGSFVQFEGGNWSEDIFAKGKTYRVHEILLKGHADGQNPRDNQGEELNIYHLDMTSRMELKEEPWVNLPSFKKPFYPIYVEGKVVSEEQGEGIETYQIYQDAKSQDVYKLEIPLWENQKVIIPFTANLLPGHFYFPYFKKARVLVALEFQSAWIKRFLEWRPGARLAQETQGNHLLLGWTHENELNETSLKHIYAENKPELHLKRTNKKDIQTLEIKEGSMTIEVKEEQ